MKNLGVITSIPLLARQWLTIENIDTTMYPPYLRSLTKWELDNCPWWIDMHRGQLLDREKDMYATFKKNFSFGGNEESRFQPPGKTFALTCF